jgi:DNA-binding beta-propeller fold protein YncE
MKSVPELYVFPPGVLPICVSYIGEEEIYVTCDANNLVQVFDRHGTFVRRWGRSELRSPKGITIDRMGIVYVCDRYGIWAFDADGTVVWKRISWTHEPMSCGMAHEGTSLYYADKDDTISMHSTVNGEPIKSIHRPGILNVTTDNQGYMYVIHGDDDDTGFIIEKCTSGGCPVATWIIIDIDLPIALIYDFADNFFLLDQDECKIHAIRLL